MWAFSFLSLVAAFAVAVGCLLTGKAHTFAQSGQAIKAQGEIFLFRVKLA
jgi:hypothetical protein